MAVDDALAVRDAALDASTPIVRPTGEVENTALAKIRNAVEDLGGDEPETFGFT